MKENKNPWNEAVKDYITENEKFLKDFIIQEKTIDIDCSTAERKLIIEKSWYDVLVIPKEKQNSKKISSQDYKIHMIEVKWSGKGNLGSFGAFTLGEWIAAYESLINPNLKYSIFYVYKTEKIIVKEIIVTKEFLDDLFSSSPQLKLYFQKPFIEKYVLGDDFKRKKGISTKKNQLKPYILPIRDKIVDALMKI
jgi:hypothetical protein